MTLFRLFLALGSLIFLGVLGIVGRDDARTGPETEKRFPPLKVPPGFKATLFACDPLIEYPSVIAAGPKANNLFVAIDYMTGLGDEIVRRDEIRLIEDTDGDGYADKSTVFAKGFNSIQGLAYHDGTVYVMHAPFLTRATRHEGHGVADERSDLLTGLGLSPEKNPTRLHCANGVTVGHDGWLYLAMGDNGTDVKRPEGDRLVLNGGGILRCRPDGRDLHVFATGLAEHLRRRARRRTERLRPRQRERRRHLQDSRLPQLLRRRSRLPVPLLRTARRGAAAARGPRPRLVGRRRVLSRTRLSRRSIAAICSSANGAGRSFATFRKQPAAVSDR